MSYPRNRPGQILPAGAGLSELLIILAVLGTLLSGFACEVYWRVMQIDLEQLAMSEILWTRMTAVGGLILVVLIIAACLKARRFLKQ